MVSRIRGGARPERSESGGLAHELLAGVRAIGGEPRLRLLVSLYGAQTLVAGALNVLIVVTSLRVLDEGRAGVGPPERGRRGRRRHRRGRGDRARRAQAARVGLRARPRLLGASDRAARRLASDRLRRVPARPGRDREHARRRGGPDAAAADGRRTTCSARVFGVLESLAARDDRPRGDPRSVRGGALRRRAARSSPSGCCCPCSRCSRARSCAGSTPARSRRPASSSLLSAIPLFAPAAAADARAPRRPPRAASTSTAGAIVVRQGEAGDRFYLVDEGELDVDVGRRAGAVARAGLPLRRDRAAPRRAAHGDRHRPHGGRCSSPSSATSSSPR